MTKPPLQRPVFLTWQAYYARLTGTPETSTCPECGAPLIPRAILPRRVHDPPALARTQKFSEKGKAPPTLIEEESFG